VTERGLVAIEQLTVGMRVLARAQDGDAMAWKRVVRTFRRESTALVRLRVARAGDDDDEIIDATTSHPMHVRDRGWVPAGELTPGRDVLVDRDGAPLELRGAESLPGAATVYNLEVEDFHTYFVGDHAVWVHNACENLPGGTPVFHGTSSSNAFNIVTEGIKGVENGFGGGELGPGFYTTSDKDMASVYASGHSGPVIIEYHTQGDANGHTLDEGGTWKNYQPPPSGIEFEKAPGDDNQYKWNYDNANKNLGKPAFVWVEQPDGSWQKMTPHDWLDSMYFDPADYGY
jgi:hypothetical protein